jgi:hypothetical protein
MLGLGIRSDYVRMALRYKGTPPGQSSLEHSSGSSKGLDGISVAYAGPNLYSSLSLIRAYLDVTLINGLGKRS